VACYRPLTGYRGLHVGASGKRGLVFSRGKAFSGIEIKIPCGVCVGCRKERARQWAIRCLHEASLHNENCFVTLTFHDKYLPKNLSVDVRDLQLFLKRLRKKSQEKIRYYACGEYGDRYGRPHYHLLIFGRDYRTNGNRISEEMVKAWSDPKTGEEYGMICIGDVTFGSASYVAKYIMKKRLGGESKNNYVMDGDEIIMERKPEFVVMSRGRNKGEGIGAGWFKKYGNEMYMDRVRAPKYYDELLGMENPEKLEKIKWERMVEGIKRREDNTRDRLIDKDQVARAKENIHNNRRIE